jgi:AraC-like DNA-binding protein
VDDKLTGILEYFSLSARVFQAGLLCHSSGFDEGDGLGYIHVLRAGTLRIKMPGKTEINLDEPSLFFSINPTTHHLHPATAGSDLVCASFDFGLGLKSPLAQALPEIMILKLKEMPSLHAALQLLFSEAQDNCSGQQSLLDRLIEVVIIQLLRELIDQKHLQTGLLAGLAEPRLAKAITAIHKEPAKLWTLNELADVAGMSRARFATRFRETVGTTPGHYLTNWRIGVAQSLLRRGKSLQLIADAVGYANASALSRAFTAHIGTSPAVWRKKYISTST